MTNETKQVPKGAKPVPREGGAPEAEADVLARGIIKSFDHMARFVYTARARHKLTPAQLAQKLNGMALSQEEIDFAVTDIAALIVQLRLFLPEALKDALFRAWGSSSILGAMRLIEVLNGLLDLTGEQIKRVDDRARCAVPGCVRPRKVRGCCQSHYQKAKAKGLLAKMGTKKALAELAKDGRATRGSKARGRKP